VSLACFPYPLREIPRLARPDQYVPVRLHRVAERIGEKTAEPKLVLTLAPLYALEGECQIYCQLSSGPFVYRIAHYLSPSERQIANAVTFKTLKQLVEDEPPSALILGAEPKYLEGPLFRAVAPEPQTWDPERHDAGLQVFYRR
jgi:hypothetical protein